MDKLSYLHRPKRHYWYHFLTKNSKYFVKDLKYVAENPRNLSEKNQNISSEKSNFHPRNPHRFRYDFKQLISACKELSIYVFTNKYGTETVDFANPDAVKMLNRAILKHFYGIDNWDIPPHYLCPPIPGRADYIHYIADLLAESNEGIIPTGKAVKVLDIGVGANCIYPIIGVSAYGWNFLGTDIDPVAIESVNKIIASNSSLLGKIECRLQSVAAHIFKGIILPNDVFDVVICNPPFHASLVEAMAGNHRKNKNLGGKNPKNTLNFGGQNTELWCEGGEVALIKKMIEESATIPNQCRWFTSLVSKKENLPSIYQALKKAKAHQIRTIDMAQGQKISRIVAWRF